MKIKNILGISMLLGLVSFVSAHVGEDNYGHHGMMSGFYGNMVGGYFMAFFGWAFMILVALVLVLLIAWLIKQLQKK